MKPVNCGFEQLKWTRSLLGRGQFSAQAFYAYSSMVGSMIEISSRKKRLNVPAALSRWTGRMQRCFARAGFAIAFFWGPLDEANDLVDSAISLDPNFALAWAYSGSINSYLGRQDEAFKTSVSTTFV